MYVSGVVMKNINHHLIIIEFFSTNLAENFDWSGHFLLADLLVFLFLGGGFEALPRQRRLVEIHENVTQTFHVIPVKRDWNKRKIYDLWST